MEWRNSRRVRMRMIDQSIIQIDDHIRWMSGLRERDDCVYYLVYDDADPIGVLDFTSIDSTKCEAYWGFYLTRGNRPGFGVIGCLALDRYFEVLGFSTLLSQVLRSNLGSYEWHIRLLFSEERHAGGQDLPHLFRLEKSVWLTGRDPVKEASLRRYNPENVIWIP